MHNDHDEADTQNRTGDLLITKPFPRLGRSTEQASDAPKSAGIPIALPLRGTLCNCGDLAALLIAEHPFCGPCANGKLRAYGLSAKPAQRTEARPLLPHRLAEPCTECGNPDPAGDYYGGLCTKCDELHHAAGCDDEDCQACHHVAPLRAGKAGVRHA